MSVAMAEVEVLQNEICRVVTSPYPVSLKQLLDLVRHSDAISIQQWADAKPCQIDALAAAVLEGLPQWQYIFDILEPLAKVVQFRNAILRQSPLLLDTLLTKAIQGVESRQKYSATCVSMLFRPLPDDIPVPASIHEFFRQSVELMASSPSAETCRPVYDLLCGIGPAVLHTFSQETLERFQIESFNIIRGSQAANPNQAAIPLCLASLARIARGWTKVRSVSPPTRVDNIPSYLEKSCWLQDVLNIFCLDRARSTLDTVMTRAIMACSNAIKGQVNGSMEEMLLAIDSLRSVDRAQIKNWMQRTRTIAFVGKFETKISCMGAEPELKAAALTFLISLHDVNEVPPSTVATSWQLITQCIKADRLDGVHLLLKHPAFRNDKSFLSYFDENMVQCILKASMKVAFQKAGPPYTQVKTIEILTLLVKSVDAAQGFSAEVNDHLLNFVSVHEFSSHWYDIILRLTSMPTDKCKPAKICNVTVRMRQRDLVADLACLFMSLKNTPLEPSPRDTMSLLMTVHSLPPCRMALPSKNIPHPTILEMCSTPEIDTPSQDWRARLGKDLLRDATRTHSFIERTVGDICRDLEHRCEDVEQPLREALKKQTLAETELEAAGEMIKELETRNAENISKVSDLDSARKSLEQAINETQGKLNAMNDSLLHAQGLAAAAQDDADRVIKEVQDQIECDRLHHAGRDLGRESVLDEQQRAIEQLKARLKDAEHHVEKFTPRIQSKDSELLELRTYKTESVEKISNLMEDNKELSAKIENLTSELIRSRQDTEAAHLKLQKANVDHASECKQLKEDHQSELRWAADEASRTIYRKDQQIGDLNSAFTEAEADAASHLRERDDAMSCLEAQVQTLASRAKRLDVLERAFAGLNGSNSSTRMETPQPARHQSDGMNLGHIPATDHTHGSNDSLAPKSSLGGLDGACDSSSSSNPTPKRSKPRRSHAPPSSKRTVRFTSNTAGRQSIMEPRRPLEELAVGIRGKTLSRSASRKRERKSGGTQVPSMSQMGLGNLEDISFSDENIFTSSRSENLGAGRDGGGARGLPQYPIEDETVDEL